MQFLAPQINGRVLFFLSSSHVGLVVGSAGRVSEHGGLKAEQAAGSVEHGERFTGRDRTGPGFGSSPRRSNRLTVLKQEGPLLQKTDGSV